MGTLKAKARDGYGHKKWALILAESLLLKIMIARLKPLKK